MSKLSFRARALDASKPMPIYMAEELPDLPDYSAINRAVPQMPSGMQKEEECEHHLQRAICAGLIIPTPEVTNLTDVEIYNKIYPADYKLPRQLIHMQSFAMEQDIPDYDMDSEDEMWVGIQSRKMDLTPLQFEEMMDRLEKSSGQTVVTLNEAKALLKEDDDLIIAVFDYWLNKRLKTQHPLLVTVKTEHRLGSAANNPYLAFRRRTDKMLTRKIRKNDETSYEKMLKLRRDLSRAVTLLEMVKRREKTKREHLHLTIEVYEKRYQAQDFNGQILAEVSALKTSRPAFAPLFTNQFGVHQNWTSKVCGKDDSIPRKEKRQYKKRKHKSDVRNSGLEDGNFHIGSGNSGNRCNRLGLGSGLDPLASSDEDIPLQSHSQPSLLSDRDDEDTIDDGQYAFRRNRNNSYLPPTSGGFGNWPWCNRNDGGLADKKYRFALTSISKPTPRCIGLARRRMGRGGRIILDRYSNDTDDVWSNLDFTIHESKREISIKTDNSAVEATSAQDWLHFRPKTPPHSKHSSSDESISSDSEIDLTISASESLPYPFPPEATSICVDVEPQHLEEDPPFTSEFNISDYFAIDNLSDFDLNLMSSGNMDASKNSDWWANDTGCSRFLVLPDIENLFTQKIRQQCTDGTNNLYNSNGIGSSIINSYSTVSVPMSSPGSSNHIEAQSNYQIVKQSKILITNSNPVSVLSKALNNTSNTWTSGNCGIKLFGSNSSSGNSITNFSNSKSKSSQVLNAKSVSTNSHILNNQSTILIPQKHSSPTLLPGLNKLANIARQQSQHQSTISTTGENTLTSNR